MLVSLLTHFHIISFYVCASAGFLLAFLFVYLMSFYGFWTILLQILIPVSSYFLSIILLYIINIALSFLSWRLSTEFSIFNYPISFPFASNNREQPTSFIILHSELAF